MMNGLMSKMKLDNKIGISILGAILVFSAGSIYNKENYMQSPTVSLNISSPQNMKSYLMTTLMSSLTMTYIDYKDKMASSKDNFTPVAWKAYQDFVDTMLADKKSGFVTDVTFPDEIQITDEKIYATKETGKTLTAYDVILPINIVYSYTDKKIVEKKLLKISLLQNTAIALNNGIAIDSFKEIPAM